MFRVQRLSKRTFVKHILFLHKSKDITFFIIFFTTVMSVIGGKNVVSNELMYK